MHRFEVVVVDRDHRSSRVDGCAKVGPTGLVSVAPVGTSLESGTETSCREVGEPPRSDHPPLT